MEKKIRKRQLTAELLDKVTTKGRGKNVSFEKHLQKITHLRLQELKLHSLPTIEECKEFYFCTNIKTLYLNDNLLQCDISDKLQLFSNLERLYLQNNQLRSISSLQHNMKLNTLYLDGNYITLMDCILPPSLDELTMTGQKLKSNEHLQFSITTLDSMAYVSVLNLSRCNIKDISDFGYLQNLIHWDISYNEIDNISDLTDVLRHMPHLRSLDVTGNPFCTNSKQYRDLILLSSWTLEMLDKKEVGEKDRFFLARRYGGPPKKKSQPKQQQQQQRQSSNRNQQDYPFPAMTGGQPLRSNKSEKGGQSQYTQQSLQHNMQHPYILQGGGRNITNSTSSSKPDAYDNVDFTNRKIKY